MGCSAAISQQTIKGAANIGHIDARPDPKFGCCDVLPMIALGIHIRDILRGDGQRGPIGQNPAAPNVQHVDHALLL